MVYKNTLEAVIENVKEIEKLVSDFAGVDQISAIDMDLTLEKVRNLYDILLLIKQSDTGKGDGGKKQAGEAEKDLTGTVQPAENEIPDEHLKETEADNISAEKKDMGTSDKQSVSTDKVISGRFKSGQDSIHDSISKLQHADDLSTQLQAKPISNIADAIGINDKFTFINELFDGDAEKYNKTIEILNEVVNFNDGYNYLIGNYTWDMDSTLVQKILNLIRRKLIINNDE